MVDTMSVLSKGAPMKVPLSQSEGVIDVDPAVNADKPSTMDEPIDVMKVAP